MSAPVLNAAFPGPTPPNGATNTAASAAVGFEAVLGMLFGSQEGLAAQLLAGAAPAEKAEGETTDPTTTEGGAEAQGLAAAFLTAPIIPLPQTPQTPAEGAEGAVVTSAPITAILPETVGQDDALATVVSSEKQKPAAEALAALLKGEKTGEAAPSPLPPPTTEAAEAPLPQAPKLAAAKAEPAPGSVPVPVVADAAAPGARAAQVQATKEAAPENVIGAPRADGSATSAVASAASGSTTGDGGDLNKSPHSPIAELIRPDAKTERDEPHGQAPAANTAVQTAAAPLTHAAVPVRGSPETVAHMAAQIAKQLEGRSTHFDIALTPAGLGRVDVRIEISAHGQLTAAMSFDNPNAAAELRGRAGELARALEQAGFDLSGGLSFDVAGDRGQAGQGAAQRDDSHSASRGRAFQAALDVAGDTAEAALGGALNYDRRSSTGVDIRI